MVACRKLVKIGSSEAWREVSALMRAHTLFAFVGDIIVPLGEPRTLAYRYKFVTSAEFGKAQQAPVYCQRS